MNSFLSPSPLALDKGLGVIRIIVGLLLIFHGFEIFNAEIMSGYLGWDTFKGPAAKFFVYSGKASELIAGVLLSLGLLTRLASILVVGTFSYITFFVGGGHFWYEDQHPFMFALFGLLFFLTGPGAFSLDAIVFKKKA